MSDTFWSRENMEALARLQDAMRSAAVSLPRAAGSACICSALHSDDPLAHPQGCPRREELAAVQGRLMCPGCGFIFSGRMTAACTCQYCGHRFPAQDAAGTPLSRYGSRQAPSRSFVTGALTGIPPCQGPHPPGYPWPCACTPLSRHGSLAGIPDPEPPPEYAAWSWPDPIPGVRRVCAGCGLDDHMPYPAGPGSLCRYCEEARRGLKQDGRTVRRAAHAPVRSDLARQSRIRNTAGWIVPATAVATVILFALGADTPAAVLIIILACVAVFRS
jgi:hypothetical protein